MFAVTILLCWHIDGKFACKAQAGPVFFPNHVSCRASLPITRLQFQAMLKTNPPYLMKLNCQNIQMQEA